MYVAYLDIKLGGVMISDCGKKTENVKYDGNENVIDREEGEKEVRSLRKGWE